MLYINGEPIFVYFGIAAYIFLLITFFFALNIRRFGLRIKKIFAWLTLISATLHLVIKLIWF